MWSFLGALFGGALQMTGALGAGSMSSSSSDRAAKLSYQAAKETNELNYKMFKENMDWQTYMANTAHQREVSDLRDAGLNPVLSATGGSGAVTPSIATPHMDSPGSPEADKSAIYLEMASQLQKGISSAADIGEKVSKIYDNLARAEKTKKETKTEVGKRSPFTWAVNAMDQGIPNLQKFAKETGGIISDVTQGMRTQINYMQKLFQYNSARGLKSANGVHDFGGSDQPGWINFDW